MKPTPRGIICLGANTAIERLPWDCPNIRGMRVGFEWGALEPNDGVFNWEPLDAALRLATQYNVPLAITVTPGILSPQWVYEAGAQSYTLVAGSDRGTMPLPWDTIYLEKWRAFLRALAAHADAHRMLEYFQAKGFGRKGELYVASEEPDNTNLMNLGGANWLAAAQEIVVTCASNFRRTPVFAGMSKPFPGNAGLATEMAFATWINNTYPGRFGAMCNSLNAQSNSGYYPNECVRTMRPSGFQMVCSSRDPERLGGTLEQAINNGIALGGQFIEVYLPDIKNAVYQSLFADANVRLGA